MNLLIKFFKGGKLYPLRVDSTLDSAIKYFNERKIKGLNSIISFEINNKKFNKSISIV